MMFLASQIIKEVAGRPGGEIERVCRCAQAHVCMEGYTCMGTWLCKDTAVGMKIGVRVCECALTGECVYKQMPAHTGMWLDPRLAGGHCFSQAFRQETHVDRCVCREVDVHRCAGAVHDCTPDPANILVSPPELESQMHC